MRTRGGHASAFLVRSPPRYARLPTHSHGPARTALGLGCLPGPGCRSRRWPGVLAGPGCGGRGAGLVTGTPESRETDCPGLVLGPRWGHRCLRGGPEPKTVPRGPRLGRRCRVASSPHSGLRALAGGGGGGGFREDGAQSALGPVRGAGRGRLRLYRCLLCSQSRTTRALSVQQSPSPGPAVQLIRPSAMFYFHCPPQLEGE